MEDFTDMEFNINDQSTWTWNTAKCEQCGTEVRSAAHWPSNRLQKIGICTEGYLIGGDICGPCLMKVITFFKAEFPKLVLCRDTLGF